MRTLLSRRIFVLCAALTLPSVALARPKLDVLSARLKESQDFRVRVQAALELGRSKDADALEPLSDALDDTNPSVRAAAAAALGKLGDTRAVPALEHHRQDPARTVNDQVEGALALLAQAAPTPHIHVKLGSVHNGTSVHSSAIEQHVLAESTRKLRELPGVDVVSEDSGEASSPEVMITTSIQKLAAARDGDAIVYSASIEYIVHTLPDQTIMARVSGSASSAATEGEARDRVRSAAIRGEVIEAAIRSALSRASRAISAAARL